MTLKQIAKEIKDFTAVRNWKNDDPNQLLVALNTELGELGEHFLWMKEFPKNLTEEKKKEIGFEMVDILIYLLQIGNKSGIEDLGKLYEEKIKKLAKKYPVGITDKNYHKQRQAYKKSGKNKLYE